MIRDDTVVRPDVMVTCDHLQTDFIPHRPSLILEILSPSTILKDPNTKFNLYQAYGVRYYIIAGTGKKQIEIFHLKDNAYQEAGNLTTFSLTKDCTVEFSVQDLLA